MSIGDLIHAYSYTYTDQVIDGLHGIEAQQAILPPHLIDVLASNEDGDTLEGIEEPVDAQSSFGAYGNRVKRSRPSIEDQHERALDELRKQRRKRAARQVRQRQKQKRTLEQIDLISTTERIHNRDIESGSSASLSTDGKTKPRRPVPADPVIPGSSPSTSSSSSSSDNTYTAPTAASFYIPTLPGLPSDSTLTLYGGHLPSTITASSSSSLSNIKLGDPSSSTASSSSYTADGSSSDAHLFFFLAKAKHIAQKQKLVIWLNGGPGCSSFDGALMEIGPLRMVEGKKGDLFEQDGAWNEYANVMFSEWRKYSGNNAVAS